MRGWTLLRSVMAARLICTGPYSTVILERSEWVFMRLADHFSFHWL
jgi:hypothetical protein